MPSIMKIDETMLPGRKIETNAKLPFNRVKIKKFINPIKGGTDRSTMTSKYYIMTSNLYTAADDFYSKYEWTILGQII